MRQTLWLAFTVACAASAGAQDLVLTNANIVDPAARTVVRGSLWIEAGRIAGRGAAAGQCFTATKGHCSEYGIPTRVIDSPDDARRHIAELSRRRPDVVKVVYDHVPGRLPSINRPTLEALVAAAATTRSGQFLGRQFGVQPGDAANLVVLDASPIDDIANTQNIAMVAMRGRIAYRR